MPFTTGCAELDVTTVSALLLMLRLEVYLCSIAIRIAGFKVQVFDFA